MDEFIKLDNPNWFSVVVAACVAIATGFFSWRRREDKARFEALSAEVQQYRLIVHDLKQEIDTLRAEAASLRSRNDQMQDYILRLERERTDLLMEIRELKTRITTLEAR